METLTANISSKAYRTVLNGREYLVAPLTMMVPGVIKGSAGPLFYPPELVSRIVDAWNGMPIVVYHPTINGQFVSARRPDVMDSHGIGSVYNARTVIVKGKDTLVANGWFDVETTSKVDKRVLDALEAGLPIELSTGLNSYIEPVQNSADYNGVSYTHVVKDYLPDHLAILPDQTGACSLKDGCGVFNSTKTDPTDTPSPLREPTMAFDRVATIGYLTANCDCWKGETDKALLEALPDAVLTKLEAGAKKAVTPAPTATVTTNVVPTSGTVTVANASPVPVAQPVKALNMQDWLAAAPTEAQQVWNNAVRVNNQHRSSLIGKLTANVADGDRKTALIQLLSTKSVDELQVLADSLSPPAATTPDPLAGLPLFAPTPVPTANYLGASGLPSTATVNNGVKDEDDDILPLPVYNWGEQAREVS